MLGVMLVELMFWLRRRGRSRVVVVYEFGIWFSFTTFTMVCMWTLELVDWS